MAVNERRAWWRRRHRRILIGMILLGFGELVGVVAVGPGFWVGFGLSLLMLLWYVRYLRLRALASARTPRKALTATEHPRHYVPRQPQGPLTESEPTGDSSGVGDDPRWPEEPPPVAYEPDEDDEDDDDPAPTVEPPKRRRGGGIRGRSYESPAANV